MIGLGAGRVCGEDRTTCQEGRPGETPRGVGRMAQRSDDLLETRIQPGARPSPGYAGAGHSGEGRHGEGPQSAAQSDTMPGKAVSHGVFGSGIGRRLLLGVLLFSAVVTLVL